MCALCDAAPAGCARDAVVTPPPPTARLAESAARLYSVPSAAVCVSVATTPSDQGLSSSEGRGSRLPGRGGAAEASATWRSSTYLISSLSVREPR